MYPSMVNAYFNPPANEIVFPAGILRPPFFAKDWYVSRLDLSKLVIHGHVVRPVYLQYGAFGQVAAHELTVRMHLILFAFIIILTLLCCSMPSTPLDACIIKTASSSNGGQMRRARASRRSRNASRSNIRVCHFI